MNIHTNGFICFCKLTLHIIQMPSNDWPDLIIMNEWHGNKLFPKEPMLKLSVLVDTEEFCPGLVM